MLPYRSEGKEVQVDVNEYFNAYHFENISLFILITVFGVLRETELFYFIILRTHSITKEVSAGTEGRNLKKKN